MTVLLDRLTRTAGNGVELAGAAWAQFVRPLVLELVSHRADPRDAALSIIGTDPPPLTNTPNRAGQNPHVAPRSPSSSWSRASCSRTA